MTEKIKQKDIDLFKEVNWLYNRLTKKEMKILMNYAQPKGCGI